MSFEETLRQVIREELERNEERVAARVAEKLRGSEPTAAGDRLLRLTEAQELFGYAPETLRKWIAEKRLTRFGTVRATRVSEREVRALLAKKQQTTSGQAPPTEADILELARARAARGR